MSADSPISAGTPISAGAKDLRDLKDVSRSPMVAIMQKQVVPPEPRVKAGLPIADPAAPAPVAQAAEKVVAQAFQALKQFGKTDWQAWLSEYVRFRFGPKHAFQTWEGRQPADGIYTMSGDDGTGEIRIGLAGDWGTGTDEAHRIATLMTAAKPHYTIHLGDVYFVGDSAEVRENFLGIARPGYDYTACEWPAGSKARFALNGNHEMYARGLAYFDEILPAMGEVLDGKPQGQPASYFCLKNEDWCILGLDTGYNSVGRPILEYIWKPDAALPEPIVDWLRTIAQQIRNQTIIVLTHHQVLSAFDECYTRQADQIFSILQRPVLWFWGHEHRLVLYRPYENRARNWPTITGRCIGHGGMPVDLPGRHKSGSIGKAAFVDRRRYHNDEHLHVGVNGFVQLTLKGRALSVDYVDVHGDRVFTERFEATAGSLTAVGQDNVLLDPV